MLLSGGLVFDGRGNLYEDHGGLIDRERIARFAPLGEFTGYTGPRVDTAGCTVLPGLIDCHVHLIFAGEANPWLGLTGLRPGDITLRALEHAQALLKGGITAARDCGGMDYLEFAVRDACNAGRFDGPINRAAGRMICMTGGHGNRIGRVADGVEEVVRAVREQIHAGSDLIKIMATGGVMTPGVNPEDAHYSAREMAAGIAEGHRFNRPCASHAQGTEGILNAVRGGADSIEHGIFLDSECVDEMCRRGTFLVPTLLAMVNILRHPNAGIPSDVMDKAERIATRHRESIKTFYQAGGKIAMGTDAGTPFNHHGGNAMELHHMVETGVTPADALTAATSTAAALMRLDNRGRIFDGMIADLLIVDGNPLSCIFAAADRENHRTVIKSGIVVAGIHPPGRGNFEAVAETMVKTPIG